MNIILLKLKKKMKMLVEFNYHQKCAFNHQEFLLKN